jgi:hypothetical protein
MPQGILGTKYVTVKSFEMTERQSKTEVTGDGHAFMHENWEVWF